MPTDAPSTREVTCWLLQWRAGDEAARNRLFQLVDRDLRMRAARALGRERPNHTLQPTELVNEAYLRLTGAGDLDWQGRSHFFAIATKTMRRILVDHARRRLAEKRGGEREPATLDEGLAVNRDPNDETIAVHEALGELEKIHPRPARAVEMKYFGGMKIREIAEALGVSPATVKNDVQLARAWLHREMDRSRR